MKIEIHKNMINVWDEDTTFDPRQLSFNGLMAQDKKQASIDYFTAKGYEITYA
jgi:hypothetical protein